MILSPACAETEHSWSVMADRHMLRVEMCLWVKCMCVCGEGMQMGCFEVGGRGGGGGGGREKELFDKK